MKTLAKKLKDAVQEKEHKNKEDKNFQELEQIILQLDQIGHSSKSTYSLPPVDTIGKTTYHTLNRKQSNI